MFVGGRWQYQMCILVTYKDLSCVQGEWLIEVFDLKSGYLERFVMLSTWVADGGILRAGWLPVEICYVDMVMWS